MNEVLPARRSMTEQGFSEEIIVDLSDIDSFENILFELSNIIEKNNLSNEPVRLNFGDLNVSQDIMSSIQALLKSFNVNITMIYSSSMQTKITAIEAGLTVSGEMIVASEEEALFDEENNENDLSDAMDKVFSANNQDIVKEDTLYIKQTLRSGQKVEHDGNIVIIGDCKAGSEVVATGDITIWGVLSGIAHAGSNGDYNAKIRSFKINAIQLRIADLLARKPDNADLEKYDKNGQFTPEEAKITNGEIVIYTEY